MFQIDVSTAATTQPASTAAGTAGFFTDGNAATGVAATVLPAEFMNMLMMEMLNAVKAGGLTPSKVSFDQLASAIKVINQKGGAIYAVDSGAANAYAVTYDPIVTALSDGMVLRFVAANANTGASTFSANGLDAKPLLTVSEVALIGGEIAAGSRCAVMYSAARKAWVLLFASGGVQRVPAPAVGDASTQAANAAFVAARAGTSGSIGLRNKLINGNFDFWQRGVSFTAAGYSADRWKIDSVSNVTVSRGTASAPYGKYSLLLTPSAATNQLGIAQTLDDFVAIPLTGKRVTFSFQANAGAGQSLTAYIQKSATAASSAGGAGGWTTIATKVCAVTTAVQAFSISADVPNDGTANGLRVAFSFSNATNGAGGIGIWGCQLEEGGIATPFEFRHLTVEAVLCQAYYEVGNCAYESYGANPNYGSYWHAWTVRKRAAPTVTLINTSSGANSGTPTVAASNAAGFRPRAVCSTTGQQVWTCDYTADAEL